MLVKFWYENPVSRCSVCTKTLRDWNDLSSCVYNMWRLIYDIKFRVRYLSLKLSYKNIWNQFSPAFSQPHLVSVESKLSSRTKGRLRSPLKLISDVYYFKVKINWIVCRCVRWWIFYHNNLKLFYCDKSSNNALYHHQVYK